MKLNQNWDKSIGILSAFIALAVVLWVFFDVRNVLVYLFLALAASVLAHNRMKRHETPFERKEREMRRLRM